MPDPDLEALREEVARLRARQAETDSRLAFLEDVLSRSRPPVPAPLPAPRQIAEPAAQPLPPQPAPAPAAPQPHFETRMGLTWINRVGAVTLVLGVGFFFKYAIDNQWIGETGRVLLGILAGIAAIGVADLLWKRDQKIFAQGISGTGIAILYLSFYAAFGFYRIVSPAPAFLAMVAATVLAGALALRYDAEAIAALGLFGGYATPLLLSTGVDRAWFFFSYLLLLNAGAITMARRKNWRGLEWLALGATAWLFAQWYGRYFAAAKWAVATLFAILFHGLFASSRVRAIAFASQFAAALGVALFCAERPFAYFAITLALTAGGLALADRRSWPGAVAVTFAAFWLSYASWRDSPAHAVGTSVLFLTAAFALFLAWTPWRLLQRKQPFTREDFLLIPLNGAAYFGASYSLLHAAHHAWLGALAAALAAVYAGLALLLRDVEAPEKWLCAGVGGAFLTLAIPIQLAGFRITMAWALEAAAIAWIGMRTNARRLVHAACGVFALTLLRLAAFDAWMYPSPAAHGAIFNLRFLTFATAAASLWACAYWTGRGRIALGAYLSGHFVMVWGLILEVIGWAVRTSAPGNLQSVESASISILMAVYAVLLVGVGAATRTAVNRTSGLALIGLVVAKLYLYDVWLLVRIYRVAAFAALGALLLLTSYLYSRYRESIESFWSDK